MTNTPMAQPLVRRPNEFGAVSWKEQQSQLRRQAVAEAAKLSRIIGTDFRLVPLEAIKADSPGQSRTKAFDPDADEEDRGLVDSIREIGLLQPVILVALQPGGGYRIQAGHRRVAAMRHLGYPQIQALVVTEDTPELACVTLAENVRKELASTEKCRAVEYLRTLGYSVPEIASKAGISVRSVERLLAIGTLAQDTRHILEAGAVALSVAAAVSRAPAAFQNSVAQLAVKRNLTGPETELLASRIKAQIVEGGETAVDVEDLAAEVRPGAAEGSRAAPPVDSATPSSAVPTNQRAQSASKAKLLTDRGARDVLLGYFPMLSLPDVTALAAEAAKRRLSERGLRLAGACVASGRQKPAEALQTALRLERSAQVCHWLAVIEAAAETRNWLEDNPESTDVQVLLAFAAQQFGELLKMAGVQPRKRS